MAKVILNATKSLGDPGTIEQHFGYNFTVQEFAGDETELGPNEHAWKNLVGEIPKDMLDGEVKAGRVTVINPPKPKPKKAK